MALYRLSMKIVKEHVSAKVAYIEREGKYSKGKKAEELRESWSDNLPSWAVNSSDFWNDIESEEKAGQTQARGIELALPVELSEEEQKAIVQEFCDTCLKNHAKTVAIHDSADGKNPHAHIYFSERLIDGREEPPRGKYCRQRTGYSKDKKINGAERKQFLIKIRHDWENIQNEALLNADCLEQVSCESLEVQGVVQEAQIHVGYKDTNRYRKTGEKGARLLRNEAILERNKNYEIELAEAMNNVQQLKKEVEREREEAAQKAAEEKRRVAEAEAERQRQEEARRIAEQAAEAARKAKEAAEAARKAREEEAEARRRAEARAARTAEKAHEIAEKPIAEETKQNTEVAAKWLDSSEKMANSIVKCVRHYGKLPWDMPTWPTTPQKQHQKGVFDGFNQLNLSMMAMEKGYTENRWVTRDFIEKNGGYILRGEKAKRVFADDGKIYGVYNIKQTGMLPMPAPEPETPKKPLNIDIKPESDGIRGEIVVDITKALLKQSFVMSGQPSRLDPERAAGYLNSHPDELRAICYEAAQWRERIIEQVNRQERPEPVKEPERKEPERKPEIVKIQKKEKNRGFER